MNILSFTTLWPNPMQPLQGIFNRERVTSLAKFCKLQVIAPVPWFLPVKFLGQRYYNFSQIPKEEVYGNLKILHPRYLVIPKVFKVLDGSFMNYSLRKFLRKLHDQVPIEVIDAYYAYPDGFAAGCLAKVLGVPYTITTLGSDINTFGQEKLRGALVRRGLLNSGHVFCVCDFLKREIIRVFDIPSKKISVMRNGVDCRKFYPIPKQEARRQLQLPTDAHIILSVGALRKLKGFHQIIEAIYKLQMKKGTSFHLKLLIVGEKFSWEPSYKDQLARQITENGLDDVVFLMGPKDHHELKYWFSAADVFCLASSREGCPNVILESLACGTPVVATPVGGVPEIISTEEVGILVEQNPEDICQGIAEALSRKWNHKTIVEYAKYFSWEETSAKIYNIFKSLL